MCDTFVVVRSGRVVFGKNSDRDPNEAQILTWIPERQHALGSDVTCTWQRIPQARRTHAVLLSRPYWMWGAEMGANDAGVVVGNEAVFTRGRSSPTGLLGMDLVRLALERGDSAVHAVTVLRELIGRHGQGGRAGLDDPSFAYDSSFLVADANGAFVVESAGRETAVMPVKDGVRAISNGLTLDGFRQRYADPVRGRVAQCAVRRARVEAVAHDQDLDSALDVAPRAAAVLRDHGPEDPARPGVVAPRYAWLNGAMAAPCMHAGGVVASSQTVASWISVLEPARTRHFATATAAPCLAAFKPVALEVPVDLGSATGRYDEASHFWHFERLHRRLVGDAEATAAWTARRDRFESSVWSADLASSSSVFRSFETLVDEELARQGRRPRPDRRPAHAQRYWAYAERRAKAAVARLPPRSP